MVFKVILAVRITIAFNFIFMQNQFRYKKLKVLFNSMVPSENFAANTYDEILNKAKYYNISDSQLSEFVKSMLSLTVDKKIQEIDSNRLVAIAERNLYHERYINAEKQMLQAQGLMNSRGIFEWFLNSVAKELQPDDKKKLPTNTDVCGKIAGMVSSKSCPESENAARLYDIFLKCNVDTPKKGMDIYKELFMEIHGYQWKGSAIHTYFSKVQGESKVECVITKIAKFFNFELYEMLDEP